MSTITGTVGNQALTVVSATGRIDPYSVLNLNMKATGGEEKLKKENFYYFKGEMASGSTSYAYEEWTKKPLMSLFKVIEGSSVILASGDDGKNIWSVNKGKLNSFDDSNSPDREYRKRYENYDYLDPKSNFFKVSSSRLLTVDGTRCYEVKITNRKTSEIRTQYYDSSNFLLKREIKQNGSSKIQTDFSKYLDIGGVMIAHKRIVTNLNTDTKQTLTFSEVTKGKYVSSEKFKSPEPKKAAITDDSTAKKAGLNIDTYA